MKTNFLEGNSIGYENVYALISSTTGTILTSSSAQYPKTSEKFKRSNSAVVLNQDKNVKLSQIIQNIISIIIRLAYEAVAYVRRIKHNIHKAKLYIVSILQIPEPKFSI